MPRAGGERERVAGVTLGLLGLTPRDRHARADRQRPRQVPARCRRNGLLGPATGGGQIPVCQRGLGVPDALPCRRHATHDTGVLPGGLTQLVHRCTIPGGQGRHPQSHVPERCQPPAMLRAALNGRLSRRPGRGRLTLPCECQALAPEAEHPVDLVVGGLGLGGHHAELCDSPGQITLHHLRRAEEQSDTHAS